MPHSKQSLILRVPTNLPYKDRPAGGLLLNLPSCTILQYPNHAQKPTFLIFISGARHHKEAWELSCLGTLQST